MAATTAPPILAAVTPAHLLAYALDEEGLPANILLRHGPASSSATPQSLGGSPPRLAIALRRPVPTAALVRLARDFRNSDHAACLILGRSPPAHDYSEHLLVTPDSSVLKIERRFRRHSERLAPDHILGIITRAQPHTPPPNALLPLLRDALAHGGALATARIDLPADPLPPEADILDYLTPETRRRLAARLQWKAIAPDCYASPFAIVSPHALLRGPLFIDAHVTLGPDDIHIGPAFLRPAPSSAPGPAITIAPPPTAAPGYFVGSPANPKPIYDACKRLFDFTFSLAALLALSPILLLTALAIWLSDFGPVLFSHEREGLHGKPFNCLKFRTMIRNAEALKSQLQAQNQVDGPQFKIAHDPRITRVGRFLRRTNIDELPQFWNVLLGHMSVVGPRPSPFKENQLCPPWREARLSVKPGITGLWQVSRSPIRGPTDFQEWIFYDTQYVDRRNLFLDLKIILLTVKELLGKGQ